MRTSLVNRVVRKSSLAGWLATWMATWTKIRQPRWSQAPRCKMATKMALRNYLWIKCWSSRRRTILIVYGPCPNSLSHKASSSGIKTVQTIKIWWTFGNSPPWACIRNRTQTTQSSNKTNQTSSYPSTISKRSNKGKQTTTTRSWSSRSWKGSRASSCQAAIRRSNTRFNRPKQLYLPLGSNLKCQQLKIPRSYCEEMELLIAREVSVVVIIMTKTWALPTKDNRCLLASICVTTTATILQAANRQVRNEGASAYTTKKDFLSSLASKLQAAPIPMVALRA